MNRRVCQALAATTLMCGLLAPMTHANAVATTPSLLIYGPTLFGSPQNEQTIAESLGYTVTVVDEATWSSMTTSDFASYSAIVFGDPTCIADPGILDSAVANRTTWSPAVTGNIVVIGTDPVFHQGEGQALKLIANGLSWTAHGSGTGLYADLSCYYGSSPPGTTIDLLAEFGSFGVQGQVSDPESVGITVLGSRHPVLRGITSAGLSNWGNSIHEEITASPPTFGVLTQDKQFHLPVVIATAGR
jgi:hypothetical protein